MSSTFCGNLTAGANSGRMNPGLKSIVEILRELERKGFDGSLEIIDRADAIVMLYKSETHDQRKSKRKLNAQDE